MREPREHARDEPSAAAHEGNRRLGALVGEDRKRMWAKLTPRFIEQQVSPYCVGPQGSPSSAARRGWGQPPSPQPAQARARAARRMEWVGSTARPEVDGDEDEGEELGEGV